jgi:hypothetical protein
LRDLAEVNIKPTKVFIEAQELELWCHKNDSPNNASARSEFVAEKLRTASHDEDAQPFQQDFGSHGGG